MTGNVGNIYNVKGKKDIIVVFSEKLKILLREYYQKYQSESHSLER